MAITPRMLCLILAVLCFAVAAFGAYLAPGVTRFNLVAAGLGFTALALLFGVT